MENNKFNIDLDRVIDALDNAILENDEYSVDLKRLVDKIAESDSFATLFHKRLRNHSLNSRRNHELAEKISNFQDVDITKNLHLRCTSQDFTGEWMFIDDVNGIEVPKLSTKIAQRICYDVNTAYAIAYTRSRRLN